MNFKYALFCSLQAVFLLACAEVKVSETPQASLLDIVQQISVYTPPEPVTAPEVQSLPTNSEELVHHGIDISHYQGDILKELKPTDSIRFLICKATQGMSYVDPFFRTNWHEIQAMGVIRGAYHFFVCDDDPLAQATHFVNSIEGLQSTDLAPVLDVEQGSMSPKTDVKKIEDNVLVFLKEVERRTNRKPILYTGYAFGQQYLKNPVFADYELWLAEYSKADEPKIPTTWQKKGYKIWQRSESYTLEHEKTDLDVFYGKLEDLVK